MLQRKTSTSKPRKAYFTIFFGGIALLTGSYAVSATAFSLPRALEASAETAYVFENEAADPIPQGELSVSINTASVTETSEAFRVNFSASVTIYNNGRYTNVWVKPSDDFDYAASTQAALARIEEYENGTAATYEPETIDCSVYKVVYTTGGNKNPSHIVIPAYIGNSRFAATNPEGETVDSCYFRFRVNSIESRCVFTNNTTRAVDWTNIESVTIPSTVETASPDAFIGAKDAGIQFYFQDTQEEFEEKAWGEGWTDAEDTAFHFDATFDPAKKYEDLSVNYIRPDSMASQQLGVGENYILGCLIDEEGYEEYRKPLVVKYRYTGENAEHYIELPITSKNYYDAVGPTIGAKTFKIDVELPLLRPDQHVDPASISFHNIYYAVRRPAGQSGFLPNLERGALYSEPVYNVARVSHVADFLEKVEFTSLAEFLDFTQVSVRFSLKKDGFKELNPSSYAAHTEDLATGLFEVRTQFTSLPQATYEIVYDGGKVAKMRVNTPIEASTIRDGAEFGFLIHNSEVGEGFSAATIEKLTIHGFNLHYDLYRADRNSIANNSKVTVRFGNMVLFDRASMGAATHNLGGSLALTYVIYVASFLVIATAYYFITKTRFKNDEFRRMNTKRYLIEAGKNFLGLGLVVSAVFFIIARWGVLNNAVVAYNPCDPFVILFTITGLIYVGLAIKNIVVSIKLDTERRRKARLKIDQDVVEDGTN